jgi:hypothetical protein
MGGGGGILSPVTDTLFGSPKTVDTPDYTGAANQTAANNLAAARAATAANRVNQTTAYGGINYTQNGTDSYGNPMWAATQTVAPELQNAVTNSQNAVSGYNYNPFSANVNSLQTSVDPSVTGQQGWDNATNAILQRLNPTIAHQNEMSDQDLANKGIMPGSEAYNNAIRLRQQGQNDLLTNASLAGSQVQNQMYNQALGNANLNNSANAQSYGQQANAYGINSTTPFTQAASVKSLATPNYVNPASQTTTAGADITGAMGLTNQSQQANANAQNAQSNAMMSGLFSLAGAGIGKYG